MWLRRAEESIEQGRVADQRMDYAQALELTLKALKLLENILDADAVPKRIVDKAYAKYDECSNLCESIMKYIYTHIYNS